MARSMLKRDVALVILGLEAAAIVGVVYFLITLDFMSLAWAASIAIAIPAWILAVKAPTQCGVTTQTGGQCTRKVNGVIFGCGTSDHTWAKFLARFGWRRQPDPDVTSSRAGVSGRISGPVIASSNGVEMVTVKIAEDTKSKVAFWLALTATTCALTSATVDATNFVKERKAGSKAFVANVADTPAWDPPSSR